MSGIVAEIQASIQKRPKNGPKKKGPNGPQIDKHTIQKTLKKNNKKISPKLAMTGPQMGSQSGAKMV